MSTYDNDAIEKFKVEVINKLESEFNDFTVTINTHAPAVNYDDPYGNFRRIVIVAFRTDDPTEMYASECKILSDLSDQEVINNIEHNSRLMRTALLDITCKIIDTIEI